MGTSTSSRLREARLAAGLTQEQLGVRAGVTAKTVASLEKGYTTMPLYGTALRLAEILEVDPRELFGTTEAAA